MQLDTSSTCLVHDLGSVGVGCDRMKSTSAHSSAKGRRTIDDILDLLDSHGTSLAESHSHSGRVLSLRRRKGMWLDVFRGLTT